MSDKLMTWNGNGIFFIIIFGLSMLLWYVIMDKENFLASNVAVRHPKKKKGHKVLQFIWYWETALT